MKKGGQGGFALDLGPAHFTKADLRGTQFHGVTLDGADFSEARLEWAEFHACSLRQANFSTTELTAAIFRHSHLTQAVWEDIKTSYRAQFLLCEDAPRHLPQTLQAPGLAGTLPQPRRLAYLTGHSGGANACAFSPDGARLLSAGEDRTLRLWDAATGECLRIHAISGGQAGHAVWSPVENRVIEADGEAWRWLAWIDGQGGRWPLESFGPVPAARLECKIHLAPGAGCPPRTPRNFQYFTTP